MTSNRHAKSSNLHLVPQRVDPDLRRPGVAYTPEKIVAAMIQWSSLHGAPARVVDAGAGTGHFAFAAAERFTTADILAIEIDPTSAKKLRAAVRASPYQNRITVWQRDFLALDALPNVSGCTLFIGNPPYVRHHLIPAEQKRRYQGWLKQFGLPQNSKAGLHLHFLTQVRRLASHGDYGIFITAAEWMQASYGRALRALLLDGMGGISIDTFKADDDVFPDHMTTATVVCFELGRLPTGIRISELASGSELTFGRGTARSSQSLHELPRWSAIVPPPVKPLSKVIGDFFKVRRGQVTGMNDVWINTPNTPRLPSRFLKPTITRAREIIAASGEIDSKKGLRRVINLPHNLDRMSSSDRYLVDRFLAWARSHGAHQTYIARQRSCWWAVDLYEPAPIICTYMARRPPAFALNTCAVPNLNISHCLYPTRPLSTVQLHGVVDWLNTHVTSSQGRSYARGLVKFEPSDIRRLAIPDFEAPAEHSIPLRGVRT